MNTPGEPSSQMRKIVRGPWRRALFHYDTRHKLSAVDPIRFHTRMRHSHSDPIPRAKISLADSPLRQTCQIVRSGPIRCDAQPIRSDSARAPGTADPLLNCPILADSLRCAPPIRSDSNQRRGAPIRSDDDWHDDATAHDQTSHRQGHANPSMN